VIEHHQSVMIGRPPSEVFRFLADFERTPEWVPQFLEMKREGEGPLQVGSTFSYVRKLPVGAQRGTMEITAFQEGRLIGWRALPGPVLPRGEWAFAEVDGGTATKVDEHFAAEIIGPLKLLAPLLRRQFQRNVGKDLQTAKRLLEAGTTAR
jgi:uncharacterized membrane protein